VIEAPVVYSSARRDTASAAGTTHTVLQRTFDLRGRLECEARRMNPDAFLSLPTSACSLGTEGGFGPDRITRQLYDAAGQLLQVQRAYGTELQQNDCGFRRCRATVPIHVGPAFRTMPAGVTLLGDFRGEGVRSSADFTHAGPGFRVKLQQHHGRRRVSCRSAASEKNKAARRLP
jgi:hypothetical protein